MKTDDKQPSSTQGVQGCADADALLAPQGELGSQEVESCTISDCRFVKVSGAVLAC